MVNGYKDKSGKRWKIGDLYTLPQPDIGGYLMAGHLKGFGGAINLYYGRSSTDGNGTSTTFYYSEGKSAILNANASGGTIA